MHRLALVLALAACGSSKPPQHEQVVGSAEAAGDDREPEFEPIPKAAPKVCPASFADAKGACPVQTTCTYPEGTCACADDHHCAGASLRDEPPKPLTWQCSPPLRADGCPGAQPMFYAHCKQEGKQCRYDTCCVVDVTCQGGQWREAHHECPS